MIYAPRMTDADDEAWNEILAMEQEFRAEERAPKVVYSSTEHLVEALSTHVGFDASKLNLPSRDWTPDEAFDALRERGVTSDSFRPKRLEDRLYPSYPSPGRK